ncbi:per1-like family protein [Hirsutella rhossiliensis]|uniref:Post-GPI attachment to proteins factor 3 n=1 Tax=Hirsutella rhossiliensis TaxID=111463 RepID=A0A9P8MQQ4_9HYPO|nr:per1-like family domain-containing protein [Hirsutella rhossiliensis]KAH0957492.1 per1-like family domain-containing protein [Hirsutella rhossiliensis]
MPPSHSGRSWARVLVLTLVALALCGAASASVGDRSAEFRKCLEVCRAENCAPGKEQTPIPLRRRLLLWNCASECDYTCQHIVTAARVADARPIVQFHGKWPFYRFLGMQEPFSVLFSLGNLWAHWDGLRKVRASVPASYPLRPWYEWLARIGITSWVFSALFHTRDFPLTEQLDYFAAGASVLYGMYYSPIRIFRLDRPSPRRRSLLRLWSLLCALLYLAHVAYLKGVRWDYTYNMAANVAAGIVQNILWSWFSYDRYRKSRRSWATWPGLVVAWVTFAMSMELFDFPPWLGCIDAHSLWHLLTIGPTILWYNFLVKDSRADLAGTERLKA